MKKTILMIAGLIATVSMMAQGSVNFHTRVLAAGVDAKVTDGTSAATPLPAVAAGECFATLYVGTTTDNLAPAFAIVGGAPVALLKEFNGATGYITAGKTLISGYAEGATVFVQVRAWSKSGGATYEAAFQAALTETVPTIKLGVSNPIQIALGGDNLVPPATPANLVGLQPFSVNYAIIPEPSILALGLLGGAACLLRRRS
jgi:hypothetical protein